MSAFDEANRKTARTLVKKAKAMEKRPERTFFLNAAILSVYGWQLSIPVLLGVALGQFLDRRFPSDMISWTLNCIFIGFIIGVLNANRWLHKEGRIRTEEDKK